MLKFWKRKKPADAAPAQEAPVETAADIEAASEAAAPVAAPEPPTEPEPAPVAEVAAAADVDVPPPQAVAEPATPPAKRSWRERLAGSGFARGLSSLFTRNPVLDDAFLDELETCLITADVGVAAATELIEKLRKRVDRREFADAAALLVALRAELVGQLKPVEKPLDVGGRKPFVLLMVGVNGVGKTTTIGKLAFRFSGEGRSVLLAAGDTFRAAAVEQLQTWGTRNGVPVIAQGSGADSASVIFDALQTARSRSTDVLIADTAGRLHTQSGLMDELAKIRRVLGKLDADAPHEALLVIDGTTGQNAISQVRQFQQAIGVSGLVVTKLDGTAKGGVVFALAREFGLPIRYVGLGESAEDLRPFDAAAFVDGLLPATLGNG
ncbi:signal recognition particle-docking protein FtsY [Dokdonella sp.]|uniref:signal recognition particle-docking protein FtsY n=1 Tax=Dokdonella sp. TaxID=2291710 RepID=UPI0025C589FC|nr:signal recognition particle-docking protein FtsY [Dokdonella sp.]